MGIPDSSIFCERDGATFLVVNWRERRSCGGGAALLKLSPRHAHIHHRGRCAGRSEKSIYYLLVQAQSRVRTRPIAPTERIARPTRPPTARARRAGAAVAATPPEAPTKRPATWTAILASGTVHGGLLLGAWGIYWVVRLPDPPTPPVRMATLEPPHEQRERRREERPPALAAPELEAPPELELPRLPDPEPTPVSLPEDDPLEAQLPSGRAEAVSASELGGAGAFVAIGAGGGGAGMFGARVGHRKARALALYGGNEASEAAVAAALRWFKKHQSGDGRWSSSRFFSNCTESPRCEPGAFVTDFDVAMTGYAVLCYLGAGYDHQTPSQFSAVVKRALGWLVGEQHRRGGQLGDNYQNAIATMALVEAFAMTGDPALKEPAKRGVALILARQNRGRAHGPSGSGRLGWDYNAPNLRNDASVSGWNVMALKSAYAAGFEVTAGMDGSRSYLEDAWKATNPTWASLDPYTGESRFPYAWTTGTDQVEIAEFPADGEPAPPMGDLSGVGALCAVFLGHRPGDTQIETLANYIARHQLPTLFPCNTYYLYYDTLALFQLGGERWTAWNGRVRDLLVAAQRRGDGCFDGSWNGAGAVPLGDGPGRLLATAYCCLSLEVYYRYRPVGRHAP
jgi:hypothetical protein